MEKINDTLKAIGVTTIFTAAVVAVGVIGGNEKVEPVIQPQVEQIGECKGGADALDLAFGANNEPTARACLTDLQYTTLKADLLNELNDKSTLYENYVLDEAGNVAKDAEGVPLTELKAKDFDFEVDSMQVLGAVMLKEARKRGGVTMPDGATKEEIRTELIKLLQ